MNHFRTAVCGLRSAVCVLGFGAFVAAACARPAVLDSNTPAPTTPADTALGRAVQVGPDPVSWTALTLSNGTQLRLNGAAAAPLAGMSGAQVWVSGARDAAGFRVDAFEVRMVNDHPVDDGIVVVTSTAVSVRLRSGAQREVPYAPPAMRDAAGARVWVSRPVAGVAPSWGVIQR